jgi:hypothetical protein
MNAEWESALLEYARVEHTQHDKFEELQFVMIAHFPFPNVYFRKDNAEQIKKVLENALSDAEKRILNESETFSGKKNVKKDPRIAELLKKREKIKRKVIYQYQQLAVKLYGKPLDEKKPPSTPTDDEEAKCDICLDNIANILDPCGNRHPICHLCFGLCVHNGKGTFKCPQCRAELVLGMSKDVKPSANERDEEGEEVEDEGEDDGDRDSDEDYQSPIASRQEEYIPESNGRYNLRARRSASASSSLSEPTISETTPRRRTPRNVDSIDADEIVVEVKIYLI